MGMSSPGAMSLRGQSFRCCSLLLQSSRSFSFSSLHLGSFEGHYQDVNSNKGQTTSIVSDEVDYKADEANASTASRKLTHVDAKNQASMVDISTKASSVRVATASCLVILGQAAFTLVKENQIAKGDVLTVAKIAGITGAKQTSSLIPLCHHVALSSVDVQLTLDPKVEGVRLKSMASCVGGTGVEMEALTAVSIAALTVYDMCKAVSKHIEIQDIRLESKSGGKSGDWKRV